MISFNCRSTIKTSRRERKKVSFAPASTQELYLMGNSASTCIGQIGQKVISSAAQELFSSFLKSSFLSRYHQVMASPDHCDTKVESSRQLIELMKCEAFKIQKPIYYESILLYAWLAVFACFWTLMTLWWVKSKTKATIKFFKTRLEQNQVSAQATCNTNTHVNNHYGHQARTFPLAISNEPCSMPRIGIRTDTGRFQPESVPLRVVGNKARREPDTDHQCWNSGDCNVCSALRD